MVVGTMMAPATGELAGKLRQSKLTEAKREGAVFMVTGESLVDLKDWGGALQFRARLAGGEELPLAVKGAL